MIALQWCVVFCSTTTRFSYKYTCIPSLLSLSPLSPSQSSRSPQSTGLKSLQSCFTLAIYFTQGSVHMSMLLSQFTPPSHSPTMSTSLFSTSVSLFLPCRQIHQYYFHRLQICINIRYLSLFLTSFTLYNRLQVHPLHYY